MYSGIYSTVVYVLRQNTEYFATNVLMEPVVTRMWWLTAITVTMYVCECDNMLSVCSLLIFSGTNKEMTSQSLFYFS